MEVYEPEEVEEPDLTGDIFTEAFHRLSYSQQYRCWPPCWQISTCSEKGVLMATRKENIDIEYDEPQQEATLAQRSQTAPTNRKIPQTGYRP